MSRRKPKREPGTTRFAACPCPHCGHFNDAATNFYADVRPKSGSIAICFKCGAVSLYTDAHGRMRKATPEEMQEMRADAELWTLIVRHKSALLLARLEMGPLPQAAYEDN